MITSHISYSTQLSLANTRIQALETELKTARSSSGEEVAARRRAEERLEATTTELETLLKRHKTASEDRLRAKTLLAQEINARVNAENQLRLAEERIRKLESQRAQAELKKADECIADRLAHLHSENHDPIAALEPSIPQMSATNAAEDGPGEQADPENPHNRCVFQILRRTRTVFSVASCCRSSRKIWTSFWTKRISHPTRLNKRAIRQRLRVQRPR